MNLDKKEERLMEELHQLVEFWLRDVKSLGNQTAYSDSILDSVLKKADEIRGIVEAQFGR